MSSVGRKDPCPCGSGKKFKKCCLAKGPPTAGAFTEDEWQSALEGLRRFAGRVEFDEERVVAEVAFWASHVRMYSSG